jgi:transposase
MDVWDVHLQAVREVLPQADLVHHRCHISAHLDASVDRVRIDEHKQLVRISDETLKDSKHQWMPTYPDSRAEPKTDSSEPKTFPVFRRNGVRGSSKSCSGNTPSTNGADSC